MSYTVRKLPDEPIVIVAVCFPLEEDQQEYIDINYQVARIAARTTGPLYRITDMRHMKDFGLSDIYIWLQIQREFPEGSILDPRVCPLVVGNHNMVDVAVKKVYSQMGIEIPQFPTLSAALGHIRAITPEKSL